MSEHRCVICAKGKMYRSGRRGLWETYILPLAGRFPWRCGFCHTRVYLADRGSESQYVQSDRPKARHTEVQDF